MIVLSDADLERAANARRLLLDVQRRPDVHLDRARLRRGAGLRRVRGQGDREGARAAPRPPDRARHGRRRLDDLPAAGRHRRAPRRGRRSPRARRVVVGGHARGATASGYWFEPTVLVDVDHTMDVHARGDLRPDAADHEGGRRRGGHPPGQRLARTGSAPRSSPRTSRAARPSRGASRPAPCASTTRSSTTPRSSCRWAAGRPAGWARATAPAASASSPSSRRCSCRGCTPKRDLHMYPYSAKMTGASGKLVRLLYGRGKRD